MVRTAFTLMELLIVMLIIAILAGLALAALAGAAEEAKADRTRAIIAKLDQLIAERYDSYRTRALPIRIQPGMAPRPAAMMRLNAMRELQRMELPNCQFDVLDNPVILGNVPALSRAYRRKVKPTWSSAYEEAECLYLIVSTMHDGDKNALDFFMPGEIGDTDNPPDGMPEILDGWGKPINFIRWPSGYRTDLGAVTMQDTKIPDPFDPTLVDGRPTFALRPLIWSIGPDRQNGLALANGLHYSTTSPPNDPYQPMPILPGTILTAVDAADNITNHWQNPSQP